MRHGARADLEGRGGMKAVDRQHDVAMQIWEGGAMRESAASATLVASCASHVDLRGRRHKRERERAADDSLVAPFASAWWKVDTGLRLAWWAGMELLGMVGLELIPNLHVSGIDLSKCVCHHLTVSLGDWNGIERLASP
jgi:hypothetical protein